MVNLKTNHRQGEDKQYADMLNRFRVGAQTTEDVDLLKTRVVTRDDKSVPADALMVSGTNAVVDKHNLKKLNQLRGELVVLKALVHTSNKGEFKPPLYYGTIIGTTLQYELKLKIGCKVIKVCGNGWSKDLNISESKAVLSAKIKIADITQHSLVSSEVITHKENGKGITKTYDLNADSKLEDVSIAGYKIVHKKVLKEKSGWRTLVLLEFKLI